MELIGHRSAVTGAVGGLRVRSKERYQKDQAGHQKQYRSHHGPKTSDGGDDEPNRG